MRRFRRLGALALSTFVAGAFVTGPAHAATPETYLGTAAGVGFNLELLGQKLTFGATTAKATSALEAVAEGAGQLLVLGSTAKTNLSGQANARQEEKEKCATPDLSGLLLNLLDVGLACGSAVSEVVNGNPRASSEASIAKLDVNLSSLLSVVPNVTQTLNQTLGSVAPALDGLLGQVGAVNNLLPALNLGLDNTVNDLLNRLQTQPLLQLRVGKGTSDVTTVAGTVTSVGSAQGATIDVLPLLNTVGGAPLISVIVGDAKASAVYDRAKGVSNATFDAALVRVRLGLPLLGGSLQEITVPVGQTITLLAGTPLESTISVADGRTVKNADGSVGAIADGVSIHLLKGVSGGILLQLAHAEAGVAGALATVDQIIELPRELPRTGGIPWMPFAGTGLVGLAVLTRRFVLSK